MPLQVILQPIFFRQNLEAMCRFLRSKGIRLLCYMDDFLIAAAENDICEHRDLVLDTLKELGWCVNYEKSSLEPRTCTEFLGFMVDSLGKNGLPELSIPGYKIKKLSKDIRRILSKDTITARQLARIIGRCSFMCKAIFPGRLQPVL